MDQERIKFHVKSLDLEALLDIYKNLIRSHDLYLCTVLGTELGNLFSECYLYYFYDQKVDKETEAKMVFVFFLFCGFDGKKYRLSRDIQEQVDRFTKSNKDKPSMMESLMRHIDLEMFGLTDQTPHIFMEVNEPSLSIAESFVRTIKKLFPDGMGTGNSYIFKKFLSEYCPQKILWYANWLKYFVNYLENTCPASIVAAIICWDIDIFKATSTTDTVPLYISQLQLKYLKALGRNIIMSEYQFMTVLLDKVVYDTFIINRNIFTLKGFSFILSQDDQRTIFDLISSQSKNLSKDSLMSLLDRSPSRKEAEEFKLFFNL